MTNEKMNVPELRFPGFEGEWKKKLLDEIANVQMGQSPNSQNYTDDFEEMVLVQGNADLKNGKVSPRIFTKEITKIAKRNDILLSVRAPVGEIGITQMPVCIGRGVCSITSNLFTYYFLDYFNNGNKWKKFSQGSTFEAISGNEVRNLIIFSPSEKEQQKIGDFFSKLDRQIELEEQKLEKLEQQKKGYMQKIFSQQLRFKDENGNQYPNWKGTNIGNTFDNKGGTALEKEFDNNGTHMVISIGSYSMNSTYNEQNLRINKNKNTEKYLLNKGDLAMVLNDKTKEGNIIGRSIYIEKDDKYIYNQRTERLIPVEGNNNKFLWYLMNSDLFRNKIKRMMQGATQVYINYNSIKTLNIYLPIPEEQDKIENFLTDIFNIIKNQAYKVELLKERKNGFLQKMFV
ncbi:restriction endonuclease subunit S [Staphylococcus kloosii]|uniref:restriction endonuclease subunit S n=1 Tax=Staphylococcus kloosii TaxID=29384 RepID=UPI00189F9B60|nr:restriction endonuclease subunit S [Staphylococcus kloosii]MBF7020982.1 restriction endonuclease subunit S [Staphylococcus kloosii]